MVMNADELRATGTGDWLAQLKNILQLGPDDQRDYGNDPKAEWRKTKTAVKVLLSNLRKGLSKTPDGDTTDADKDTVIFNAVDRLIQDKVAKSTTNPRKTKLEAIAKFEDVLKQELAAKANKNGAIANTWQGKINDALQALRTEELDKILLNNGQNALEVELDKLILNKDQKALAKVLENNDKNAPPKLLEHCVKKMLASNEGKKALESSYILSENAFKVLRDPQLAEDLLTSCNSKALNSPAFGDYVKTVGDQKDDILTKLMQANLKKPLPTQPPKKKQDAANDQAASFGVMGRQMDPAKFTQLAKPLLTSKSGKKMLADNPKLAGELISSIDPAELANVDLDKALGTDKEDILIDSIHLLSERPSSSGNGNGKPPLALDTKLFKMLATKIDPKVWNDKTPTTGPRKGLGPRVGMELWNAGGYQEICDLIKHGVDTSLCTVLDFEMKGKEGSHSGFVEPMQHIIAPYLRDVGRLEAKDSTLTDVEKPKAEGAQKIFKALAAKLKDDEEKAAKLKEDEKKKFKSTVTTLTSWSDLQKSEWMTAFKEKPGTIWGFENVRAPYVQAGHGNTKKSRPLRMWELWDALGVERQTYDDLLKDPEGYADKTVARAAQKIKDKKSTRVEYGDIKNMDEFLEAFKKDAKTVLLEFAAQMPKGTFADSEKEAGFMQGKFMGGLACKAGLWWAKEQKEPIYYCLDGINMDDVTNYKILKNTAIDDFLSGRTSKRHNEVITMVEVREILKNWEDLKYKNEKDQDEDVVKFVYKGKILSGPELDDNIKKWKSDLKQVNTANPTPAPDYKTFTNQLNKIDPNLLGELGKKDVKTANREAREIVKKHGYFIKLANTKPHIALKYIMSKCDTLAKDEYKLISKGLPPAAVALKDALASKDINKIATAEKDVRSEIANCNKAYREPLESALFPKPKPQTDTTV
jgi:hypothetical protein